ncbi:DUF6077 domain-containing protein [Actinomadura vinacea]|uniref:DUF6077 domain-containing protein n=1 Tax=Actinomadura vinacea TaxID=115336 RepID=UPI0031DD5628
MDEHVRPEQDHGTAPGGPFAPGAALTRALDRGTDGLVIAFALWTLVYHAGLLVRPPTWVLLAVWAVATAAAGAGYVLWRRSRAGRGAVDAGGTGAPADRGLWRDSPVRTWAGVPRLVPAVALLAGVGAGTSAGLHEAGVPWWCTWSLGLISVAATAYGVLRLGRAPGTAEDAGAPPRERPGDSSGNSFGDRWGSLVAFATAGAFAAASWFMVNPDGDDAYFVSRSVAAGTDGRIPQHDVIFSTGSFGPIAGEPPVSSVEVLAGALARLTGVHPTSFLWYAVLPAVTFVAVWALWRLVREWAPRWALACFVAATAYLLWSGVGQASLGSFHLLRMWQGKAMMVSIMVPLLYVHLTRWAERRTAGGLVLLTAAGVAAVGLSSSATLVVPLVTVAAAAPLVLSGRVRTGAAACAAMVYPLAAGLAVVVLHHDTSVVGPFTDAPVSYSWVLLSATMGVLTGCALWAGSRTARPGVPSLITAGVAGVATLLLVPGVLDVIADATGAAQVMWRTMWVVPAPALVGLLAAVRPPEGLRPAAARGDLARALPAAVPVALCAAMVVGGVPLWSGQNGTTVTHRPAWKFPQRNLSTALAVVRAGRAHDPGRPQVVLMPQQYMRAVPLLSTRDHAINPNSHYLRLLPAPRAFIDDRLLLTTLVTSPQAADPSAAETRAALRRTGVTAACARRSDQDGLRLLEAAGYGNRSRVGKLTCVFPGRT